MNRGFESWQNMQAVLIENRVEVVIPSRNRAELLLRVLPSYIREACVARVIIVDDGSDSLQLTLLRKGLLEYGPRVHLIESPRPQGQQASRKRGIAEVKTPWMLFGEDDVWLQMGYVDRLLQEAVLTRAAIVAGRLINKALPTFDSEAQLNDTGENAKASDVFVRRLFSARFDVRFEAPIDAPYLHTIALIQVAVFSRVTFDESYRGNAHREETDFYLSCNAAGFKVMLSPNALCYHLRCKQNAAGGHRGKGVRLWWAEYWNFRNTYRLLRKHRRFLAGIDSGFRYGPEVYIIFTYLPYRICNAVRRLKDGGSVWHNLSNGRRGSERAAI